jgi:hypothetical protein
MPASLALLEQSARPTHPERRRSERFACAPGTLDCVIAGVGVEPWLVPVRNISSGGLNIVLRRKLEPGTIITVKLFNAARLFECDLRVRVIYNLEREDGDVLVGGAFLRELDRREVQGLL